MNNRENKKDNDKVITYDDDENIKINYSDFLKDAEEIEAQIKKEEEAKREKIKSKIKLIDKVLTKDNNNINNNEDIDFEDFEIVRAEKVKKRVIIFSSVFIVLIAVYMIISFGCFNDRFLPSTIINGIDCSNKTVDEVSKIMDEKLNDYHLKIIYNDIMVDELYGKDINLSFGDMGIVLEDICDNQKKLSWVKGYFCKSKPINTGKGLKYDTSILNQFINSSLVLSMTSTVKSVNAGIAFKDDKYVIVPAVYGDEINKSAVVNNIIGAVNSLDDTLDINKDDCFIKPSLTEYNENLINSCNTANKLIKNRIELNVTDDLFEIPISVKKDWLNVNSEGKLIFNSRNFAKYMDRVDKSYSSNSEVRKFKTFHGDTVNVTGGDFGTALDRAKLKNDMEDAIFSDKSAKVTAQFNVTQKEIGDSYIEVDLSNQMLWMFVKGEQKLCTPIISGRDDGEHLTSGGVYRLKSKTVNGSVTEKGEVKKPKYWMSISDVLGICDAGWKNLFGGENYKSEGSDGSIYVIEDAAKTIYDNSFENMPIVCYHHAIVEDYFIEDSYMNELMNLIANKPEIPEYKGENSTEETTSESETTQSNTESAADDTEEENEEITVSEGVEIPTEGTNDLISSEAEEISSEN